MAVTLQQIAEAAGVSRGTVDRAMNNRGRINPEVADTENSGRDGISAEPGGQGACDVKEIDHDRSYYSGIEHTVYGEGY